MGDEKRIRERTLQLVADGWFRAYYKKPNDGQLVRYTFPTMSNAEFDGQFNIEHPQTGIESVDKYPVDLFHSNSGFLCDDDVYWVARAKDGDDDTAI